MPELPFRRRLASATAGLIVAGLVLTPGASSRGNPHGTPPGQAKNNPSAVAAPLPPGQAKKQAPAVTGPGASAAAPVAGAPAAGGAPSAPRHVPPGQAKKSSGAAVRSTTLSGVAHGNPNAPGQIKKAAASSAKVATVSGKVPPGQAKKAAAPASTPVTAPTPAPVTPATTVTPQTPTATPSPPAAAATPPATGHSGARHHRRSTRRTRHRAGSAGRRRSAGTGTGTAATRTTRRVTTFTAAVGASATGTARTAGRTRASRPSAVQTVPGQIGHGHGVGPASSLLNNLIPVPLPVPDWSKPIILALVLICALLGIRAWLTSRRAHRLDAQRRRLAADLDSLQPALVPEIPASFGPLAVSVAYRPADGPAAGGDFYDVFSVGGNRVAMMVGDVSGHGRAALTRAAHMRYMLRAYVETGLDPRSALKLAGRVLGADHEALFTTVAVAVYDAPAATLTYAAAGHPPPLLLGPAAHEPLTSCASPALGWGEPTGRRQTTVPFSEGARACFFSDGVTEVRIPGGLLGRENLADEVGLSASAAELLQRVQGRARAIRDDMAACVVDAQAGSAISENRIDEFEVEPRHLDAGQGARFLRECGVPADNAKSVLDQARLIAEDSGSALLRVEISDSGAHASAAGSAPVSLGTPPLLAREPDGEHSPARA